MHEEDKTMNFWLHRRCAELLVKIDWRLHSLTADSALDGRQNVDLREILNYNIYIVFLN